MIIHWLGHAAFQIASLSGTIIYFDPFQLSRQEPKADIILISHDHYDHCDTASIKKIIKPSSIIIASSSAADKLKDFKVKKISAGEIINLQVGKDLIEIEAVPSYNLLKEFHPKSAGNVGFIVKIGGKKIYHVGDSDYLPKEMKALAAKKIYAALLPVGGTYTMSAKEAVSAALAVGAEISIPMHYGLIVGKDSDGQEFKNLLKDKAKILEREK
ncbi:MAG: MBL fold metallo-hydrolase [Elusimicrobia bacterium]|nr:MBL fold metallo-hydrolase [Elusimicrobiota bacterium]